jgi:pimeloyl-ACP methyl ester carboxylesterase
MMGQPRDFPVSDGALAALDFGGGGVTVLLVHGSGHNACAWADVAQRLVARGRVIALDLRGHGQTRLQSTNAEQYWRDLGPVCRALGPCVLVGHSTGGYAVCAATAAGLVAPLALCVVDGFVLDERAAAAEEQATWSTPASRKRMQESFRYGWVATEAEMQAYIEACARSSSGDWLNAGATPELVRQVVRRSFVRDGDKWLRRPTLEEIAVVSNAESAALIYPSIDLYDAIRCPVTFAFATRGFYTSKGDALDSVVAAAPDRVRIDVDANHNVPMTRPVELAEIIADVVREHGAR